MQDELQNVVTLLGEKGEEVRFDHLMTFEHAGKHYIALMPMDETEGLEADEVVLLEVADKGGEDIYVSIENEALMEEVFDTFLAIMDEEEERDSK